MTDFRDAWRALRATPLVTSVAILSLALGIGANTAMFSIVDALVLRALPVRHADRLAVVASEWSKSEFQTSWTNPIWEAIRDRPTLFDGAFAYSDERFNLAEGGEVVPAEGLLASGRMFEVLGVDAILGRTFTATDDRRGGGPDGAVAVISYSFWQRRFKGAADVVGRTISLNRAPFTIVGVTGPEFFGPDVGRSFEVAVPLSTQPLLSDNRKLLDSRSSWWLRVIVRLAPGQRAERATAAIRAVQRQIADETRPTDVRPVQAAEHLTKPLRIKPAAAGDSELREDYQRPLFALMAVVGLTLLIACGNIANLLLARATARRHELSVRTALGASSVRLARQLFSESLLLACLGAALGVVFAYWGSRMLVTQLSTTARQVFLDVGIDARMLGFTAAVAVGTAILFGTVPALRAARIAPSEAMKEQGRGTSSGRRVGLAGSLVMAQIALSLVLLIGTGLFVRTFASLSGVNPGFERDRALLVQIDAQRASVDSAARGAMYERVRQEVMTLPGVTDAAISMISPVSGSNATRLMEFPGRPELPESERRVWVNYVTPGWFRTLGTPMVAGRDFGDRDRLGAPRAVIVNQAFVARHFGATNPLGRIIRETAASYADSTPLEIVGVVSDAVYRSLKEPVPPTMYWPLAQRKRPPSDVTLIVRSATGSPVSLTKSVAAAVTLVNRDLSLTFRPLADQVNASITQERLVARLSGFFGALALLLAALGLYGITAYAVSRRQIELGIRMALGTSPLGVVRLVLARTAVLVVGGLGIGALVSWWAAKFVGSMLYGLQPRDPATIMGAIAVLAVVGLVAGLLPAQRAARIDPSQLLRDSG